LEKPAIGPLRPARARIAGNWLSLADCGRRRGQSSFDKSKPHFGAAL